MKKNTVSLDLKIYNDIYFFNEKVRSGMVALGCVYKSEYDYQYLTTDEAVIKMQAKIDKLKLYNKIITVENTSLKIAMKEHPITINLKAEILSKFSIWEFIKWRKGQKKLAKQSKND